MKIEFIEYTHSLKFKIGEESLTVNFKRKTVGSPFEGSIIREGFEDFIFPWRGSIERLKVILLIEKYLTLAIEKL